MDRFEVAGEGSGEGVLSPHVLNTHTPKGARSSRDPTDITQVIFPQARPPLDPGLQYSLSKHSLLAVRPAADIFFLHLFPLNDAVPWIHVVLLAVVTHTRQGQGGDTWAPIAATEVWAISL